MCLCCDTQGTARRKKKVVHKTATDDKKLQVSVKENSGGEREREGGREGGREGEWEGERGREEGRKGKGERREGQ